MGILTLAQIRTEIDSVMGNRTGVLDPRLNTWVNLAYTDVATGIDFEELDSEFSFNTANGVFSYPGPINPLVIQLVRDNANNNLLTWVPKNEWYRLNRSVNGVPLRWTRRGPDILIFPPANGTIAMVALFKRTPSALVADGDVTILPAYIDNALIFLGAAYAFMAVNENQRAIIWLNRAINYLSSRITNKDFSFLLGGLAKTQPPEEVPVGP